MNFTATFFNNIVHLLYPHICAGCGSDLLSGNSWICFDCLSEMPETNFHLHEDNPVEKIFWGRLPLVSATAFAYFTTDSIVRHLLHRLKYGGNRQVGIQIGQIMGERLKTCRHYNDLYALIPLPLFYNRQKKRGYNQAEMICEGLSQSLNVPVMNDIVTRRKNTQTQTQKSRIERWSNIEGKFELINTDTLMNKHVLLVDDVVTTGATLEACATELLKTDGLRLSIAAFAFTSL